MQENVQESMLEMHLDYDGGNILRETVRWSRFLSVVGLIGLGVCLLVTVLMLMGGALLTAFSQVLPGIEGFAGVLLIFCLFVFGVVGVLVWMLYRFSTLIRRGIEMQDQAIFNQGMKSLKIYFLISGIFAILGLLINLISLTSIFHS
jgi:hypothetical protein